MLQQPRPVKWFPQYPPAAAGRGIEHSLSNGDSNAISSLM